MSVVGTINVTCPECGAAADVRLVQSIDPRTAPGDKQKLLAGELNVMHCECGKAAQLAATVVYTDAGFLCQVCPGDDEMERAAELIRSVGATGTRRLVPSVNALVEKVKLFDAQLQDWAIEMTKVLLLASMAEPDLDRVLLFDHLDRDASVIHWLLFDGSVPEAVASPLSAYTKLVDRAGPTADELQIDRAWAVEAVRRMLEDAN